MRFFQFGVPALALLSASLVLGACSSEDPEDDAGSGGDTGATGGSDTGGSGNGGEAPSTGGEAAGTGGADDGGRGNIPCEAAGDSAVCVNDTDCPLIEDGTMRSTAKNCLLDSCLADSDQAACVSNCVDGLIGSTDSCSLCYGASASCSANNCLAECAADGDAPGCTQCQAENGCLSSFFECSGLAQPD